LNKNDNIAGLGLWIKRGLLCAFVCAAAVLCSAAALAQTVPGAADVNRFQGEMEQRAQVPDEPRPEQHLPINEVVLSPMMLPPGAADMTFTLTDIHLTGVTAYKHGELTKLWRADIGKQITLLHLYEIAASITARYRHDGYVLSRAFVPAQTIGNGSAEIAVVEGYIQKVRYEGDYPESRLLQQARNNLLEQRPLNIKTLERQMLLLNDLPGTAFQGILKPMRQRTEEGKVEENREAWRAREAAKAFFAVHNGDIVLSARPEPELSAAAASHRNDRCDMAVSVTAYLTSKKDKSDKLPRTGKVIFMAAEDGGADAVTRQLAVAGANMNGCRIIERINKEDHQAWVKPDTRLQRDLVKLEAEIKKNPHTKLIVLDPVEGYLGDAVRKGAAPDARDVLAPLARIADKHGISIMVVTRSGSMPTPPAAKKKAPVIAPDALPNEPDREGGVLLVVNAQPKKAVTVQASLDNYGSRFVGPVMAGAKVSILRGLLPYQETDIALNTSVGNNSLRYIGVTQVIPLSASGWKLYVQGSAALGHPGFTLTPDDITSRTYTLGAHVDWDALRQRTYNLKLSAGFEQDNSKTDAFGEPFTRDHLRIASLASHFNEQDSYQGASFIDMKLSRGLNILDATASDDILLSRANANPEFTKLEASLYRFQTLNPSWTLVAGASGQMADSALPATQQFGYGGQAFGRAYDPSEIVGDQGVAGMAELRYNGVRIEADAHMQPFLFYDFGKIWNRDPGQARQAVGASAGAGTRIKLHDNFDATVTVAEPLNRTPEAPQLGAPRSPRVLMSMIGNF
jgi:hemolysin activation/secretion protein